LRSFVSACYLDNFEMAIPRQRISVEQFNISQRLTEIVDHTQFSALFEKPEEKLVNFAVLR